MVRNPGLAIGLLNMSNMATVKVLDFSSGQVNHSFKCVISTCLSVAEPDSWVLKDLTALMVLKALASQKQKSIHYLFGTKRVGSTIHL